MQDIFYERYNLDNNKRIKKISLMKELEQIIISICRNKGLNTLKKISGSTNLRKDLGFDSFDLAELTVLIEKDFGIDIFEDSIVETVAEICKKLKI